MDPSRVCSSSSFTLSTSNNTLGLTFPSPSLTADSLPAALIRSSVLDDTPNRLASSCLLTSTFTSRPALSHRGLPYLTPALGPVANDFPKNFAAGVPGAVAPCCEATAGAALRLTGGGGAVRLAAGGARVGAAC